MSNDNSAIPGRTFGPGPTQFLPHRSNKLAIAEGLLLLGGLAALHYFGILPFSSWPVHPCLFVVMLLSAQYGVQGGVLAAVGAIAVSHLEGWPVRPIDMTQAEYFQATWAEPLSWVMAALMIGLVTSHRNRLLQEQSVRLHKAAQAESLIAQQYQVLSQRTHDLERSLAGRADTAQAQPDAEVPEENKNPRRRQSGRARKSGRASPWSVENPS